MAFWGLVLEPKKKYSQTTVEQPFHVTMAALDLQNCDPNEDGSSVVLRRGDSDFILCSLSKKKGIYNVPLNLDFELGGEINFHIHGNSTIHLTGCIIEDEMEGLDESDDSMEEEEEVEEKPSNDLFKKTKKLLEESTKRKPDGSPANQAKKPKVEATADDDEDEDDSDFDMEDDSDLGEEEEESEDGEEEEDDDEGDDDAAQVPKQAQQAQPQGKKQKQAEKQAANLNNSNSKNVQQGKKENKNEKAKGQNNQQNKANGSQSNGPSKRMSEGGVMIEDLQIGNGPAAKRGKMIAVYYVGRLKNNNKQFDASTSGQGFKFRLGTGEVIKGWDTGIVGMKVGGKRRLTIPPKVAYGAKGAPPQIPPNSTLVFDVELRNVL